MPLVCGFSEHSCNVKNTDVRLFRKFVECGRKGFMGLQFIA